MSPVLLDPSVGAVLLVNREGRVLAWADPADIAGRPDIDASVDVDLWHLVRGEGSEDLAAALTVAADEAPGSPPKLLLVRPTQGRDQLDTPLTTSPLRLELRRIGDGLVMGLLSDPRQARERADARNSEPSSLGRDTLAAVVRVWAGLREAMVLTTPDDRPEGPLVLAANDAFRSLFEVGEESVHGRALAGFLAPANPAILEAMRSHLSQGTGSVSDLAVVKRASGEPALIEWELAAIHGSDGSVLGLIGVLREAGRAPTHLRRSPDVDPLTGLPNQHQFISRLQRSVDRGARDSAHAFAIVGLELRDLAAVERRLGTVVCNAVLEALARRMKQCLRPDDLIARIGDRRLGVLLDHFGPWGNLDLVLDRIRAATADPYTVAGEHIRLTVAGATVPVSNQENAGVSAQDILEKVEQAISIASSVGVLRPWAGESQRLRRDFPDLSEAVQRGQLCLEYFPMMAIESGRPLGLEALLRWAHPARGMVSSADLVGDAERTRLMLPIGRWVIRQVCQELKTWHSELPVGSGLPIHMNLSASEFWTPGFGKHLMNETAQVGVDPARIQLEVPETALYRNPSAARRVLAQFQELGFEVWLDRFGEGGLHLRDLSTLPIRRVKVSPECAWGPEGTATGQSSPLLRSLLAMAREFGWKLAVSGVEAGWQRDALRDLGCELGQGSFFARPLPSAETVAWLRQAT